MVPLLAQRRKVPGDLDRANEPLDLVVREKLAKARPADLLALAEAGLHESETPVVGEAAGTGVGRERGSGAVVLVELEAEGVMHLHGPHATERV
jgi:hypothetical protein